MVEKYYGFTLKQLIGFYLLIAVVGYSVIFYVPFTSEEVVCVTEPCPSPITKTLAEILFFEPDIEIPPPQTTPQEERPVTTFCRIYPNAESCR